MEEYNAAPFTTRAFIPPQPNKPAEEREINDTLEQLPLLNEVVKHLDEQIAFFDSIDSVDADIKEPQFLVNQVAANKLAKAKLEAERSFILARVEQVRQ